MRYVLLFFTIVVIAFSFVRGAFVSENDAIRALQTQGYKNVKIIDHAWFAVGLRGCDGRDAARFTARATNSLGQEVELYVCTGFLFKGATIRTR